MYDQDEGELLPVYTCRNFIDTQAGYTLSTHGLVKLY